jgi:hypothetical protein
MNKRGITEAFTNDIRFVQSGYFGPDRGEPKRLKSCLKLLLFAYLFVLR